MGLLTATQELARPPEAASAIQAEQQATQLSSTISGQYNNALLMPEFTALTDYTGAGHIM